MAKRSRGNQNDIVSETQQNSRWFLGRRSYTSISDKTEAEWSRETRLLFGEKKVGKNPTFIYMILLGFLLPVMSYFRISESGFSFGTLLVIGLTVLVWVWIIRAIMRLFEKV